MPDFLSDEWIAQAGALVAAAAPEPEARLALAVTQRVSGAAGDGNDLVYHLTSRPDGSTVRVGRGPAEPEDVRFSTDLATAAAIASGVLNAQQAFVDGRLTVTGDVERLLVARELLAHIDAALAPLRHTTRYPS